VKVRTIRAVLVGPALVGLAAVIPACGNNNVVSPPDAGSLAPVDRVATDELVEGDESADGVPVPLGMAVSSRVGDRVTFVGAPSVEDVSNYLRDRVDARVVVGPNDTVFYDAKVKHPKGRSFPSLVITVRRAGPRTTVTVTPPVGGSYR
jgi:hypothetical protein